MIYRNKLLVWKTVALILSFIFIGVFLQNIRSEAATKHTLILYDKSKEYGEDENLLNKVAKIPLSIGNELDIKKLTLKNIDNLGKYDEIFILQTDDDSKDNLFNIKKKLQEYDKPVYYFNNNSDNGYLDELNRERKFYFYLNNVNPFEDLNNLISEINYLKDNDIKFFIEVPPIFINENSNAMGRFLESIRYAEANGGKVVLRFPVINSTDINAEAKNGEVVAEKINNGFTNYINYWAYPIGLCINDYVLYRDDFKPLLTSTNTLFLNSQENISLDIDNYNIASYENIIRKITIDEYMRSENNDNKDYYTRVNGKIAICVESANDIDEFKKEVNKILHEEINFEETNTINSYIKFNDNEVVNNFKGTFLNREDVTQVRFINEKEYESEFNNREVKDEVVVYTDLRQPNRIIKLISMVTLIIFLIILIISRNIEKKKFFK